MKPLDELYGRGTSSAFKNACRDPKVDEVELDDGSVRVYVDWKDGSTMKVDFGRDDVYFVSLTSEQPGLYTHLVETLSELTRERGVKRWLATPANDEAEAILCKRGGWKKVGGRLEWEL